MMDAILCYSFNLVQRMVLKLKCRDVIKTVGCICVVCVCVKLWQWPILADNESILNDGTDIYVRSINHDSNYKQISTNSHKKRITKQSETLPHVFTYQNENWKLAKFCKPYEVYLNRTDFPLLNFVSNAGKAKIFTHALSDGISSIINRTGAFEVGTINRILFELQKDSRLNLIDIGTNIGQHSIAAALIGRDSIAIDGAKSNIVHLCASIQYLNITKKITIIHNIVSDSRGKRHVRYSAKNDDFGTTFVESDGIYNKMVSKYKKSSFSNNTIEQQSMTLDDLLDLPKMHRFKKVFIKLDVEGHEHRVLQGGTKFFKNIHIAGIIMEWAWHVNRTTGDTIRSFMKDKGFQPFSIPPFRPRSEVDISSQNPNKWPQDVLWLPTN